MHITKMKVQCMKKFFKTAHLPCLVDASDVQNVLPAVADHGGLSTPNRYCFGLSALGI